MPATCQAATGQLQEITAIYMRASLKMGGKQQMGRGKTGHAAIPVPLDHIERNRLSVDGGVQALPLSTTGLDALYLD